MKRYLLITGAAGFIGFHLAKKLVEQNENVIGIDNLNDYYDVNLKKSRLSILQSFKNFHFIQENITQNDKIKELFAQYNIKIVVNLAAQAGVRYSLINPQVYGESNILGFINLIEACRHHEVEHFIFASSSSVYGANGQLPFAESDNVDHPVSLYAATKKSNELIAHAYSSSFNLPVTGLRFFTVYGPWGRPDMALFLFTKGILEDVIIDVFNNGNMIRDFTYIDDLILGIEKLMKKPPTGDESWNDLSPNPARSYAPYRIYNIGNNAPVNLMDFIYAIEKELGKKAKINFLPMQIGDVSKTRADVTLLSQEIHYKPTTKIAEGIKNFIAWYKSYYL